MGNDRRTTEVGGSSKKGKKGSSDKPKKPRRGLGVAQLEKIRLHGKLGSSNQGDMSIQASAYPPFLSTCFSSSSTASYNHNPNFLMGHGYARTSCDDSQPGNFSSWISVLPFQFPLNMRQMTSAPNLLSFTMEENDNTNTASCSNKQTLEEQELDLELRLSR